MSTSRVPSADWMTPAQLQSLPPGPDLTHTFAPDSVQGANQEPDFGSVTDWHLGESYADWHRNSGEFKSEAPNPRTRRRSNFRPNIDGVRFRVYGVDDPDEKQEIKDLIDTYRMSPP